MMDIEPDDGESEIICSGRPSREVNRGDDESVDILGFRRSPWDFKPGTQLVSGGPPDIPATYHVSQSKLTSLPVSAAAAQHQGQPHRFTTIGALYKNLGRVRIWGS